MDERDPSGAPLLVLNIRDIWVKKPFEALGAHANVVGLLADYHPWRWLLQPGPGETRDGFTARSVTLFPRTFGRLAELFFPLTRWQLRRIMPRPRAIVLTYPMHRAALRVFPDCASFYYVADDFSTSYGFRKEEVLANEAAIAAQVDRIIVVSKALGRRFQDLYGVAGEKIVVCPNAVPESVIPTAAPAQSGANIAPVPGSFSPLAGVSGTISSRLRLDWLHAAVEATPWLHWAFVGPVSDVREDDRGHLDALRANPRCCFTGGVSYERLSEHIQSFDVAVIPLNGDGINPTSSPVRLFSQLPFGQPILVTPGSEQLAEYQPLVRLCDSPEAMIRALDELQAVGFDDGLREQRWRAARDNTWEARARQLAQILGLRRGAQTP